ncbi:MAG: LmeA family phospholipid-binding protein [Armatimonadota bacterium]
MRLLMRITAFLLLAVAIPLALVAGGCADGIARGKAEKEILNVLPEIIGPADSYQVKVDGSASAMLKGELRGVRITGSNVRPEGLPRLARLEASATDVKVDTRTYRILSAQQATWKGWLDEEELSEMLRDRMPYLQEVSVRVTADYLEASGRAAYGRVGADGSVRAVPAVRNGREIWLLPRRVSALGVGAPVPDWAGQRVASILNPVYVIPTEGLPLTVEKIATEPGLLRLEGSLDVTKLAAPRR